MNSHFKPIAKQLLSIVTISLLYAFLSKKKKALSSVYSGGKKGLQLVIPRQMFLEELNGSCCTSYKTFFLPLYENTVKFFPLILRDLLNLMIKPKEM